MNEPVRFPNTIRPALRRMSLNESLAFPASRSNTIRSTIYNLQIELTKRFTTRKVADELIVTRIADAE